MVKFADLSSKDKELLLAEGFRWVRTENQGWLPPKAHVEKVQTFATMFIEVAIVWMPRDGSAPQILLIKRPDDAELYPRLWHISGGNVIGRTLPKTVIKGQLAEGGVRRRDVRVLFAGNVDMPRTTLEIAYTKLYVAIARRKPREDATRRLFPFDKLPKGLVRHHRRAQIPLVRRILMGGSPEDVLYLGAE